MTIGDSFSEQGSFSYINLLSENENVSAIHFNGFLHKSRVSKSKKTLYWSLSTASTH